jgi:uncharacterized repeat protein (TIGR03803 family)
MTDTRTASCLLSRLAGQVRILSAIVVLLAAAVAPAHAATKETVVLTFDASNGMVPLSSLIADKAKSLYGTTSVGGNGTCADFGGATGCGTVFELSPPTVKGGAWVHTVLYNFQGAGDGIGPAGALVFDQNGNLYGTTEVGGVGTCTNGCGTVFKLSPPKVKGGAWTESVLYSFHGGSGDGATPIARLVLDANGNLYGTTFFGGGSNCAGYGCGTVFELSPPAVQGGPWTEHLLHSFPGGTSSDGSGPGPGLIFDLAGNLYGTTGFGGLYNGGTIFQLRPPAQQGGPWTEIQLYNFTCGTDGCSPSASVVFDNNGALYGTTSGGGIYQFGTVFQLTPPTQGTVWTEAVLHSFTLGADGGNPAAGVIFDAKGNLYGVTLVGGNYSCNEGFNDGCGVVFKLAPPTLPGKPWKETVLHSFTGGPDGMEPNGTLFFGKGGLLYGTTENGGTFNDGTVFSVVR